MTNTEMKDRILEGGKLAIKRLIDRKRRDDAYLVFSQNGKVVKLKANEWIAQGLTEDEISKL